MQVLVVHMLWPKANMDKTTGDPVNDLAHPTCLFQVCRGNLQEPE